MNVEPIVMHYLTASQGLFVSPQFVIRGPDGKEWSCPDFVALDFQKRQVQIVEVTTASDVSGLIEKVRKRDVQWVQYLRPDLIRRGAIDDSWKFAVRVFVRADNVDVFARKLGDASDVSIQAIDEIMCAWKWPW